MKVLGVDFEATGVEAKTARIIEVGAILWDGSAYTPTDQYTALVYEPTYPNLNADVERVTHLTDAKIQEEGIPPRIALLELIKLIEQAEVCVAYNKAYDEELFKAECGRSSIVPPKTPWLCALQDIDYPDYFRCKQLSHLALDHGVTVHPEKLHRAIGDVELLGDLLRTGAYTPEKMQAYAALPWIYVQAVIPKPWTDGEIGKKAAIKAGFSWQSPRGTDVKFDSVWVKRVKSTDRLSELSFKCKILEAPKEKTIAPSDTLL